MTEKQYTYLNASKCKSIGSFFCNGIILTNEEVVDLLNENEQLKEQLSTWRSSCCNYLNVYSILDNEVSILKETKDLDRFFEKFDKYSRIPFYEVEKSFIELQTENEQLKQFQDRVFCWIDMHLQRLPTLRDDEFESDNEFADPSLYSGAIQILETMKKELKGD